MIGPDEVVLLLVEEGVSYDAKQRRDRDTEAIFPVEDTPTAEQEDALWIAMGCDPGAFDPQLARYHRVCIVASETSPVREWVTSFFMRWMSSLVADEGLHVCAPPFERSRATVVPLEKGSVS